MKVVSLVRRFFVVLTSVVLSVVFMASAAWGGGVEGASLLKNLLGEQTSVDFLEGEFQQNKYIADLDATLDSSGTFSFVADEGLRWNIRKPVPTNLRITSNEIVEEQDGEEVMRMDVDDQPMTRAISEVFFAIFGGDWDALAERFTIRPVQEESPWHFELAPKDELLGSYLSSIELQGSEYLEVLILNENNGDRTRIQLNNVKAH